MSEDNLNEVVADLEARVKLLERIVRYVTDLSELPPDITWELNEPPRSSYDEWNINRAMTKAGEDSPNKEVNPK